MAEVELQKQVQPSSNRSPIRWVRENLFNSWLNTVLTILSLALILYIVTNTGKWILFSADWSVISKNFKLLTVGQYPQEQLWRVWMPMTILSLLLGASWGTWKGPLKQVCFTIGSLMIIIALLPFISMMTRVWLVANVLAMVAGFLITRNTLKLKVATIIGWVVLFPLTIVLLSGMGILSPVSTRVWGGFLLTILISVVAIVCSFPIGVLLALGRRSSLPIVKWFSIAYIELIRAVPLITIIYVSQFILPIFLGRGIELDAVLRVMIGFTAFAAAYIAENVRGGLQSIPRGQFEAGKALGLNAFHRTFFIILPQALRVVIPANVGLFIGIFKDTVLVTIVGLSDLLGIGQKIYANPQFLGKEMEVLIFIAFVFFIFCYLMSYVSRRLESSLGVGQR
ncbi:amino acid ABC transporter permease [Bacillus carboniphilus]|uniref:Amino acid ABC transporter permease n=1 Tax=Bacillus carboniphilus TaxID=86663 RepID=A0ABY9JSI2_9BACI|nr:amino acid ABC transporter permease [Bacillus carboniphilus]WLR41370.1 amino acid ABC transporter permease [Bacillus carboniphilus]